MEISFCYAVAEVQFVPLCLAAFDKEILLQVFVLLHSKLNHLRCFTEPAKNPSIKCLLKTYLSNCKSAKTKNVFCNFQF